MTWGGHRIRFWRNLGRLYRNIASVRWLVLGIVVGVCSGLAASLFYLAIEWLKTLWMTTAAGLTLPHPTGEALFHPAPGQLRVWLLPAGLCGVGLVTGYLVKRWIPDSAAGGTDGTDAMINAFHNKAGVILPRTWLIRGATSILTIGFGGSAGREGPISQIGAGIGSWLSRRLRLTAKERRILLLAGAAGGLGAIFRAPLGGALTAIEVIYREDFEAEGVLPAVLSSVVAYTLFTVFYGHDPIFDIPAFVFGSALELAFYAGAAVVCAGAGWLYVRTFYAMKYRFFAPLQDRIGIMWTAGLGGLLMGILGMIFPQTLTGGYGWLELAILGQVPALMMFAMAMGKILATSLTIGSGLSGGMFAPALFVGGMSGGVVGKLAHQFYPQVVTEPGPFVLVGMAAFFSGVASAPIGPLVMVTELTQGYGLLVPLMLASALALVLCRKVRLYEHQVGNKFDSPAHIDDATINILEQMQVVEVLVPTRVTSLEPGITLKALIDIIAGTNETNFPVRGPDRAIIGMLTLQDVRRLLFEHALFELVVVSDLMRKPAWLTPDQNLYLALLKFVDTGYGQIPVVDPDDKTRILGLVNREDVFAAYSRMIRTLKEEQE